MTISTMDIFDRGIEEDFKTVTLQEGTLGEETAFIFNNLSLTNLTSKVEDLRRILDRSDDTFRHWLAHYIVSKRVTLEQNFHSLYNAFLLFVNDAKLNQLIKQETLKNIKILLRSDKKHTVSNFDDRQLLKNLGHWLGLITLARNQPIFFEDLNLRDLLLEAFQKGQQELLFVIPFVVKVILSSNKSIDTERGTHVNPQPSEVAILGRSELQGNDMNGGLYDPTGCISVHQAGVYPQQLQNLENDLIQTNMTSYYQQTANRLSSSVPHYNYIDVNIYDNIENLIVIPSHLALNQVVPNLSQHLRNAIATAVKEIIANIVERSVNVSLSMTSDIVLKDFNYVSNEQQIRRAYLQMIKSSTAAIGTIMTRESLMTNIIQYTRQIISQNIQNFGSISDIQGAFDEVVQSVIENNLEITSCYIVKTACEKATIEIEKKMEEHILRRKSEVNLDFYDVPPEVQAAIDRMPPELLPRNRELTDGELQVYDYFTSQMCGFKSSTIEDFSIDYIYPRSESTVLSVNDLEGLSKNLSSYLKNTVDVFISRYVIPNTEFHTCCTNIRQAIIEFLHHQSQESLVSLIDRLTESFLISYLGTQDSRHQVASTMDRNMIVFCEIFINLISKIMNHVEQMDVIRIITRVGISGIRDRLHLNPDAYDVIIRNRMVNLGVFDQLFSRYVENMDHIMVSFIQKLFRLLSNSDSRRPLMSYLPLTVQQMKSMTSRSQTKNETMSYRSNANNGSVCDIRNASSGTQLNSYSDGRQDGVVEDVFSYREISTTDFQCKVERVLREWMTICNANESMTKSDRSTHFHNIVLSLVKNQGIPLTLESISTFFKTCLDICLDVCYRILKNSNSNIHQKCNRFLDAFCRLMCILVKNGDLICGSNGSVNGKITLLHKVLDTFNSSLIHDHDARRDEFNGFPFYRIFRSMLTELCTGSNSLKELKWAILEAFGHAMFYIQPRRAPAFAYLWLDIVGHRQFIGQLLAEQNAPPLTRTIYTQLLISLLKFLGPSLRNGSMSKAVQVLYTGTLRVMLIVLHDFPELLCEYYYIFCDVIPQSCIQLRNLVLSAYPRNMRLPDPFMQNFEQIELLPEMDIIPKIPFEMFSLIPDDVRTKLDVYINSRSDDDNFIELLTKKMRNFEEPGLKYNIPVMNAIVSYIGMKGIHQFKNSKQTISISGVSTSNNMEIYKSLVGGLCSEGRYIFFNSITNQLRYPNAQTHYFACVLLYLFNESSDDQVREQITRVLFERLISMRPHPWGLLVVFIELIQNEQYCFWQHEFVQCAPEIERLFVNVADSCRINMSSKVGSTGRNPDLVPV
ncbi:hypothetical protein FO519_007605 [Halicephalobus sp. NKZ332]|nr:hypothetical protein FO519_007605 [Halicephalobus sp. NKZ332]